MKNKSNFMKRILPIVLLIIMLVSKVNSSAIIYLIQPKHIKNFSEVMFFCYGREWWVDEALQSKKIGGILYLYYHGGRKWTGGVYYPNIRTFPEEVNQPPIIITGKKYLVLEFEKKVDKQVILKFEIGTNEYKIFTEEISCYNKSSISVLLPSRGKSINHLQVTFMGEKCVIGIKSIYMNK